MSNKYFGGTVENKNVTLNEEEAAIDADLKSVVENTPIAVEKKMDDLRVADAITEIFNLFKRCNKYIDETMPWALAKEEEKKDRLETVLYNLLESIKSGAKQLAPFMPETSEKILAQLGDGKVVEKPEILFARLDLEEVMKKVEERHPKQPEETPEDMDVMMTEEEESGKGLPFPLIVVLVLLVVGAVVTVIVLKQRKKKKDKDEEEELLYELDGTSEDEQQ